MIKGVYHRVRGDGSKQQQAGGIFGKYLPTSNSSNTPGEENSKQTKGELSLRLPPSPSPSTRFPSQLLQQSFGAPSGDLAAALECSLPPRCSTPSSTVSEGGGRCCRHRGGGGSCSAAPSLSCDAPSASSSWRRYSFGSGSLDKALHQGQARASSCGREERGGAPSPPPSCVRHLDDYGELSDVSSGGATSEDSASSSLRYLRREGRHLGEAAPSWSSSSPMLTSLLDGHVTRLATPPDSRLAAPHLSGARCHEDAGVASSPRHHHRPRPPPAPRPRSTLDGTELIQRHGRLYSPPTHRHSRESSLERSGRDSSCERAPSSTASHHRAHHMRPHHPPHHTHVCWCEEDDEADYDSCDDRHHSHRHSYHEGLHHAHLFAPSQRPHPRDGRRHHHTTPPCRSTSPCYCHGCITPMGSLNALNEACSGRAVAPMSRPFSGSKNVEDRLSQLEGDKESLQLQVSVLSDQVEAQTDKIQDLEAMLDQKRSLLIKTEEQLQKEIITRSSLETQRLELLSEMSNMKLRQAATDRENMDLRDKARMAEISSDQSRSQSFSPTAASTPLHSFHNNVTPSDCRQTPPPNARRKIDQFGTIPRHQRDVLAAHLSPAAASAPGDHHGTSSTTGRTPKGVMFGKGLHLVALQGAAGKRSTSAPNLAETEKYADGHPQNSFPHPPQEIKTDITRGTASISPLIAHRSPSIGHKPTGIKKIFTKLRRSSSGHLENDLTEIDLKRGGLRATATARLGWTSQAGLFREPQIPFPSWSARHVEEWFGSLGLSQYSAAARCWMEAGNHITRATPYQVEKDIGVRHPLHRKKLQLAITNRVSQNNALNKSCAKLDGAWVLRWLDDLGLPQYKDVFSEARIDGLVLNYLTYDDLAFLRISNLLHVTSLKRGIQVLRLHNFDASVLKRRSDPDEDKQPVLNGALAAQVPLWTNHRVMEWLKTVDLSEYAPNLRGSGVHGALMVYEVKFTSEFLASLLSISSSKTLLRRHLSTHFKELVGKEVVQAKRELEVSPGYIPLTTTTKIKMPRKSQFSLKRRKTKLDLEFDDLICPLDEMPPKVCYGNNANREG